jgi:ATP-dependent helicase HrpA
MKETDLTEEIDPGFDRSQFPDSVNLGNAVLPLVYTFNPGEETDGVTVQVPLPVAAQLTPGQIQWMVPGLREEQVSLLLRALPKAIRRPLMPLDVRAAEVAAEFDPGRGDFMTALADYLTRKYRIHVRRSDWGEQSLPAHLCPRVEVVDKAARPVAAGRDLAEIHKTIERHDHRSGAWHGAAAKWERVGLSAWSFGDLPESIFVEEFGGAALHAFPGLEAAGESVNVRLFRKAEEADRASRAGIHKLAEIAVARDLVGLRKELLSIARKLQAPRQNTSRVVGGFQQLGVQLGRLVPACSGETFQESAMRRILENAFQWEPVRPLDASRFEAFLEQGRRRLPELVYKLGEWTRQIFEWKDTLGSLPKRYPGMDADLERLVPADLHAHTPFDRLQHLPRYLKAVQVRAEKAALKPAKEAERAAQLKAFAGWEKKVSAEHSEKFRWLLEEFRVSLFAQELGTSESVSVERLRSFGGF